MNVFNQVTHSSPPKRKVLGDIKNLADSPVSPTANLKLLTNVATANCIENVRCIPTLQETPQKTEPIESKTRIDKNIQATTYGRKYKSLGYLCNKFLKMYPLNVPEGEHSKILLSDLANQLCVEKRRVYDIINVVESLQMATKVGKNSYTWTGHSTLADTLSQLKAWAEQVGLEKYVRLQQLHRRLYLNIYLDEVSALESCVFEEDSKISSFFRNERRIGILCQKFVMLFLVSLKDGLINLDLAADALVARDCEQNKTRLRRLYDIANILVSLGIIAKVEQNCSLKKPLFRYVGPPLYHLDELNNGNILLSNLVKTELSDTISSDITDDSSSETLWNGSEGNERKLSVTEIDHSYSIDVRKATDDKPTIVQPAAKKRLVFSESISQLRLCGNAKELQRKTTAVAQDHEMKTSPAVLRVMGEGNVPQTITNGGVYKAVKVGSEFHFIRMVEHS